MGRIIGGIFTGLLAGSLIQLGLEALGHSIFPPPLAVMQGDMDAFKAYIEVAPLRVLLLPLLALLISNLCAGLLSTLISHVNYIAALVIGVLFTIGSITNIILIPHPLWMAIAYVMIPVPCTMLGSWLILRLRDKAY